MKDFLCIMMTAKGCGHCSHTRGNGIMGSGPHFMKPTILKEFLDISDKFSLLNIHFDSMSGKKDLIREISKFTYEKDKIIEEMWGAEEEHVRYHRIEADTVKKSIKDTSIDKIPKDDKLVLWKDFVNSKIPKNIENYTYYYPCFMIVSTSNWLDSIKNNSELNIFRYLSTRR